MSKGARKFVNPLTQPSTPTETQSLPPTKPSPETEMVPDTSTPTKPAMFPPTKTSTHPFTPASPETSTYTSTYEPRKRGKQAFERTHERITLWLDKGLKKRFDALSRRNEVAKSTLLDEAIKDLLEKHEA